MAVQHTDFIELFLPESVQERVKALLEHWLTVPKSGHIPRLSDYLDCASPQVQPDIAIADALPDGQIKVRLYGTRRVKVFKNEWTGRNPLDNFTPDAARDGVQATLTALRHPCGVTATCRFKNGGGPDLSSVATILPLQNENPQISTFIHHLCFVDELGEEDEPLLTLSFEDIRFFDLGAGVPDTP